MSYERAATFHEESLRAAAGAGGSRRESRCRCTSWARVAHLPARLRSGGGALRREPGAPARAGRPARRRAALNSSGCSPAIAATTRGRAPCYEESLALFRQLGDTWGIGLLLNNLARVERDQQDWQRAAALCAESLALFRELGDRHGVAWILSNLAVIAQRRGAWEWAARLHGAAEALREAVGSAALSLSPSERANYEAAVAATRAELGDDAFAAAMASRPGDAAGAGRRRHAAQRRAATGPPSVPARRQRGSARPDPRRHRPGRQPSPLTRREREVAALVARGLTDRQIAETLVIAEGTVGVHLTNIFTKLDLHARAQLAVWAAEHGLLDE